MHVVYILYIYIYIYTYKHTDHTLLCKQTFILDAINHDYCLDGLFTTTN